MKLIAVVLFLLAGACYLAAAIMGAVPAAARVSNVGSTFLAGGLLVAAFETPLP